MQGVLGMNAVRAKVWLGIVGGALIAMGAGALGVWSLFLVWSHHMFIMGASSPVGYAVLFLPLLAIAAGLGLVVRALRRGQVGLG